MVFGIVYWRLARTHVKKALAAPDRLLVLVRHGQSDCAAHAMMKPDFTRRAHPDILVFSLLTFFIESEYKDRLP